ncbi:MAG: hypothetical protein ACREBY_00625, partial [Polaromonas sp.]
ALQKRITPAKGRLPAKMRAVMEKATTPVTVAKVAMAVTRVEMAAVMVAVMVAVAAVVAVAAKNKAA